MKRNTLLSSLFALCLCFTAAGQSIAPFKAGDRVAFLGNSITDGGHYHSFVWLYYMTRFPDMPLRIFNAGIGGDRVVDMHKRFDGDVMAMKPNVIIQTFGMNDTGYAEYNGNEPEKFAEQKYRECRDNYAKMEARLKELKGVRIVQMGSSPYDEIAQIENNKGFKGKNANMRRVGEFQRESAKTNGWEFLDLNVPMTDISRRVCATDPGFTLCGGDRIHPDNDGHLVMAYLFLKEQGFAGKEVADVRIDAAKGRLVKASNCKVSGLKATSDEVSFDYLANSLPFPIDTLKRGWGSRKSSIEALAVIPFMDEMNSETLQVSGLKGDYRLTIDGVLVGRWSSGELARGVNLAGITQTPQYQQALTIMLLNEERWEIERRLREYIWIEFNFFYDKGLLFACDQRAVDALNKEWKNGWVVGRRDVYAKAMRPEIRNMWEKQIDTIVDTIYRINKPLTRKFVLEKVN